MKIQLLNINRHQLHLVIYWLIKEVFLELIKYPFLFHKWLSKLSRKLIEWESMDWISMLYKSSTISLLIKLLPNLILLRIWLFYLLRMMDGIKIFNGMDFQNGNFTVWEVFWWCWYSCLFINWYINDYCKIFY